MALSERKPNFLKTHQDILDFASQVLLPETGNTIRTSSGTDSTTLVAHLLLMMEVGTLPFGFSGHTKLTWETGTLKENVQRHFHASAPVLTEHVKLEKLFKARNLSKIARIKVN